MKTQKPLDYAAREAIRKRAWVVNNLEKRRAASREYAKTVYSFLKNDPDLMVKKKARQKLQRAVVAGKMRRLPCEKCGATPTHGHHDDYSKPLDVRWLCALHHAREHQ